MVGNDHIYQLNLVVESGWDQLGPVGVFVIGLQLECLPTPILIPDSWVGIRPRGSDPLRTQKLSWVGSMASKVIPIL